MKFFYRKIETPNTSTYQSNVNSHSHHIHITYSIMSSDNKNTTIIATNDTIDTTSAIVGYALGGAVSGYAAGRLFNGNIIESAVVGTLGGLAMGLITQNRRQVDSNQAVAKTLTMGYIFSKIALPLTSVAIIALLFRLKSRD